MNADKSMGFNPRSSAFIGGQTISGVFQQPATLPGLCPEGRRHR
jgi:hypothetical protein